MNCTSIYSLQSPPKRKYTLLSSWVLKIEEGQMKGRWCRTPYFSSSPPRFWELGFSASVYFLSVDTVVQYYSWRNNKNYFMHNFQFIKQTKKHIRFENNPRRRPTIRIESETGLASSSPYSFIRLVSSPLQFQPFYIRQNYLKTLFDLVTFDLDIWTCPRYPSTWPTHQNSGLYVCPFKQKSGNRHTDTQCQNYYTHRWHGVISWTSLCGTAMEMSPSQSVQVWLDN